MNTVGKHFPRSGSVQIDIIKNWVASNVQNSEISTGHQRNGMDDITGFLSL
jgi:hypothetical protein